MTTERRERYQFNRAHLLTTLRKGPLDSRNWRDVATSRKALHVRICQMREAGFDVVSEPVQGASTPVPPVAYVLRREPCCAHCGRGAV